MFWRLLLVLAFCVPAAAFAAEGYLAAQLATVHSTGDNIIVDDSPVGDVELAVESGVGWSVSLGTIVRERYGLEIAISRLEPDVELTALGFGVNLGSVELMPVTAVVDYYPGKPAAAFRPFVGAGLAWIHLGEIRSSSLDLIDVDELEPEDTAAWLVRGGATIRLSPRLHVVAIAQYFPVESALEDLPYDLEINPLVLSGGLRYDF